MKISNMKCRWGTSGFTMIELVVVMAVLGLLLTLAVPRYMASLERGRENVAQNNLAQMREAIDRFYGDNARYPEALSELVTKRYLRAVPLNPYTETPEWTVLPPPGGAKGAVYDVRDPTAPVGAAARSEESAPEASVDASSAAASAVQGGASLAVTKQGQPL
jgi:general secretion pathway protein G